MKKLLSSLLTISLIFINYHANSQIITPTITKPLIKPTETIKIINLDSIARVLKSQNFSADNAVTKIKTDYNSSASKCFSSMLNAGYDTIATGKAVKNTYTLSFDNTFKLLPLSSTSSTSKLIQKNVDIVRNAFSTMSFEQLLQSTMNSAGTSVNVAFPAVCKSFAFTPQQVAQKCAVSFGNRLLLSGQGGFYPNEATGYNVLKYVHPTFDHYQAILSLIRGGYQPEGVSRAIPIALYTPNGTALNNIGSCIKNSLGSTTLTPDSENIVITIQLDGSSTVSSNRECHKLFYVKMKSLGLNRTEASAMLDMRISCNPGSTPLCVPKKTELINSILLDAGFQATK